ncbi:GAF domain-containing protein [Kangiella sp.]|uniref:GAF domain-containing protein n=1 Tax=Kangiella sp. TaxID=1920245 RepID=UPI003A8D24B0
MSENIAAIYKKLHDEMQNKVAIKLFTIMVLDPIEVTAKRAFTSHPTEYPTSGSKPTLVNRWSAQVIDNKTTFIANTTEEFADVFGDWKLINQLGCSSAVNIPVLKNGIVIGTVNVLDIENYFTKERVELLEAIVQEHTPELQQAFSNSLVSN